MMLCCICYWNSCLLYALSIQLTYYKRCYFVIAAFWVIGFLLAMVNATANITWNTVLCTYRLPIDNSLKAVYMTYFAVGIVLPGSVVVYGTIRIVIVVRRTHRQISALEHSVAFGNTTVGYTGFVAVQAIRSSKFCIVICIGTLLLNTPVLAYSVLRNVANAF